MKKVITIITLPHFLTIYSSMASYYDSGFVVFSI